MNARLSDCARSFLALPRWVRWWVGAVLVPINALPLAALNTPTGRVAAAASLFVVCTNIPIMLVERGMSRLMSIPHLIAWIPLVIVLLWRLQSLQAPTEVERILAIALIVTNGISLFFDAFDSYRWLRGERAVPGKPALKELLKC